MAARIWIPWISLDLVAKGGRKILVAWHFVEAQHAPPTLYCPTSPQLTREKTWCSNLKHNILHRKIQHHKRYQDLSLESQEIDVLPPTILPVAPLIWRLCKIFSSNCSESAKDTNAVTAWVPENGPLNSFQYNLQRHVSTFVHIC